MELFRSKSSSFSLSSLIKIFLSIDIIINPSNLSWGNEERNFVLARFMFLCLEWAFSSAGQKVNQFVFWVSKNWRSNRQMFDACTAYQLHIHHQYHLYCLKIHHWHHHNQHDQFYFQYYQNWNVWRLLQKCKLRQHSNADRFCMFHKTFLYSRFFTNVFGEKIAKASRTCLLLKKTFIYSGSNGVNSYIEYLTLPLFFWRGCRFILGKLIWHPSLSWSSLFSHLIHSKFSSTACIMFLG